MTIALAATVFAVVDGVLFKRLPYPAVQRLYQVLGSGAHGEGSAALAPADVQYLREADPRIGVAAYGGASGYTHAERPDVTIWSSSISADFFDVLGQHPLVGGFTADHYGGAPGPGAARPAIVSYGFWQQRLGADPAVLGRTIDMVNARLLITGVLPRDFVFPTAFGRTRPDVLIPLVTPADAVSDRWRRSLFAVVRLSEHISSLEAQSKLDAALASRVNEYAARQTPVTPGPYVRVEMRQLDSVLGRAERPFFSVAFGGAALLVLLGAINVCGLFAARAHDRARELSVRIALGSSQGQLIRLLLEEAALVALIGGAVGASAVQPALAAAGALLPESLLLLKPLEVDARVVIFALIASLVPVIIFALPPAAAAASRSATWPTLAGGNTSTPPVRSRGRNILLAAESAVGITLVITGSLILASFVLLRTGDPGFDAKSLAVLDLRITRAVPPQERVAIDRRVLERLETMPGVTGVATIGVPLLESMYGGSRFRAPEGGQRFAAHDVPFAGAFFDVAGLRVVDGRLPTPDEVRTAHPVVVVSEAVGRAFWPGRRAVGESLHSQQLSVTVIGVVEEARLGAMDERSGEIYISAALVQRSPLVYLLRTSIDPSVIGRDVALVLRKDFPDVLVRRSAAFDEAVARGVRVQWFRTIIFGLAGGAALVLLAVGVAGLVATAVARRRREIGIRAALGARRPDLIRMIVMDHVRPATVGVASGLLGSWWMSQLVGALLHDIHPHEPAVWAAAVATVLSIVAFASWIPARRASAVDPAVVLKTE